MSEQNWLTPAELAAWLRLNGVTQAGWGQGDAKTVENLWHEVQGGESVLVLAGDVIVRQVAFVQVIIRRDDLCLVEAAQLMADGRVRRREVLPSEKFKRGEGYARAAVRCLQEELNVDADEVRLLTDTYQYQEERMERPSYPGLLTHYDFHQVTAVVPSLPTDDFETENRLAGPSDPIRIHYWAWRPAATAGIGVFKKGQTAVSEADEE